MKKIIGIVLLAFLMSCKSKAVLAEGKATDGETSINIIKNHYNNKKDFKTLYVKANAKYKDDDNSYNLSAEIKIKKDEKILVSIRFLGITMAKALITPDKVQYYEKMNNKYFEGDFSTLSKWLGTDLDYSKLQNLLTGEAMDDLTKGTYTTTIEDKLYKLESNSGKTNKAFFFEAERFLVKKEQISQPSQDRTLKVTYPNHTQYPQAIIPSGIAIEAEQAKGKTNITIDYNSATFNEEISFPYSVPEGYDRIFID